MKTLRVFGVMMLLLTAGIFVSASPTLVSGYDIGDYATDFSLKNVDGNLVSLVDYNDAKGYMVIFTCNTCPYAVKYEDRLIALDKKYKPLDVPVIAINPNNPELQSGDSFEKMKSRAKAKGFGFPYLLDEGQTVYPKYGATRTPHVYLLEKTQKGNKVRYIGAIDDNYQSAALVEEKFVENAIDAMLEGREIKVTKTRAIGCGIKA